VKKIRAIKIICIWVSFVMLFVVPTNLQAQTGVKELGFGGLLKTNGVGLSFTRTVNKSDKIANYFYSDFVSHKHIKESKVVNHKAENKMPYVFGKQFHTAIARTAFGFSKPLVRPIFPNGLSIDIQGGIGLSMACQRPVYLRVQTVANDQSTIEIVKYSSTSVSSAQEIIGYAKNGEGWDELIYKPGVLLKMETSFTWNDFDQLAKRIHIGASVDYFPKGLSIMSFGENPRITPTFFVGIMWVVNKGV